MNTKSKQTIFLLLFLILEILFFLKIDSASHSASDTLINFIPATIALAVVLIILYKEVK